MLTIIITCVKAEQYAFEKGCNYLYHPLHIFIQVYFEEGYLDTHVYLMDNLRPGHTIPGRFIHNIIKC